MLRRAPWCLLGLVLAAAPLAEARAELFSWVDDDGVYHLTTRAPNANYRPYQGEDAEGFGGEQPLVVVVQGGQERVLYPVDVTRFDAILREAAEHYRLPFAFLKAVVKVESNFNPRAHSHAHAKGLMQLIDATAADMDVEDPFDPRENIFGGARYLRILANKFDGNMALTAAAYNAGPERVEKLGRVPNFRETQRYVRRVLQMYRHYRRAEQKR
ncbi:MAG: lytic transglycosylase domain-containing protein [Myxococcales bacterium]|nr:lytic transglycosylase domain-containing protein [Myxococcales bacterium]MCB9645553.1 lytic transglycosylase domain-containing protein [Deltaproteobacteria bacterium]